MTGKTTIVCATDFSQAATAALKLSGQLARTLGGRVLAVHVVEAPTLLSERAPEVGWEAALRQAGEEELTRAVADLRATGVEVQTRLLFGAVTEQLLTAVAEPGVGMLVLGTHGRKGAAHFFLGSVAEETARRAPCPVVTTRGLPFPDDGLAGARRLRLLVAVDGSPATESALAWVRQLRRTVACDVTLLQPYWPPYEADRLGVAEPWVRKAPAPELLPFLERELRRWVGELPGEGELRCRFGVLREPASAILATEAELLQPDLVVVGLARRAGSTASVFTATSVLQAVRTPAICIPERAGPPAAARVPWVMEVLVGTDLSAFGNQAVPAAYALLRGTGGLVEICHVVEGNNELTAQHRQEIDRQLAFLAPPEAAALGIVTRVRVIHAESAATGLTQEAERMGADVVVLASHGRSGLKRAVMGSVSERMARACGRPVMILHPPQP